MSSTVADNTEPCVNNSVMSAYGTSRHFGPMRRTVANWGYSGHRRCTRRSNFAVVPRAARRWPNGWPSGRRQRKLWMSRMGRQARANHIRKDVCPLGRYARPLRGHGARGHYARASEGIMPGWVTSKAGERPDRVTRRGEVGLSGTLFRAVERGERFHAAPPIGREGGASSLCC